MPARPDRQAKERVVLENLAKHGEPAAAGLSRIIAAERPDMLLIDPMLWGSATVAEKSGIPWASLAHNPLMVRGTGLDPRGPGLPPRFGLFGKLRDLVVDMGLRASLTRSLEIVNALRHSLGLDLLSDFRDRYLTAPLIIAATAEPFEYPRTDWPRSVCFVGPLVWEPDEVRPSWINRLDERPLVVVAGSSIPEYTTSNHWIHVVFEALANEPVQVVATLPSEAVPSRVPANVIVNSFVSHGWLLPRAACVVCHGGFGVTSKALISGVPVVAIPQALDRFEVARRVAVAGAGVSLSERRLTPVRVRRAVKRAMASKAGALKVAQAFRAAGGALVAATAIERQLNTTPTRS
ncbi:MAG TPA: nucleotide disphospho-sugar-binding domain-containing protein [Gemmatimonadaceae bacterium]|nr:nucleotide disphospho-sugar-binding domain-containing protein [Gemmatimonadaceae bacterium]